MTLGVLGKQGFTLAPPSEGGQEDGNCCYNDALRQCLAPGRPSASVTRCFGLYKAANYETGAIATVILQTRRLRPKEAESLAQMDTGHRMGGLHFKLMQLAPNLSSKPPCSWSQQTPLLQMRKTRLRQVLLTQCC